MLFIFNFIALGMLAVAICIWYLLAFTIPEIGGGVILGIALGVLFIVDVWYRISVVRPKVYALKNEAEKTTEKPIRTDLIVALPAVIGTAISGKGGVLMLLPVWAFSICLALLVFVVFPPAA